MEKVGKSCKKLQRTELQAVQGPAVPSLSAWWRSSPGRGHGQWARGPGGGKSGKKVQSPELQADHPGAPPAVPAWWRSILGIEPGQWAPGPGSSEKGEKTTKCSMPGVVPGPLPVPCVQRRYRGGPATRENFLSPQSPGGPGQFPSPMRGATGTGNERPLPPGGYQGASRSVPGRGEPSPGRRRGPRRMELSPRQR